MTAKQIVDRLLEYFDFDAPDEPRAGQPGDPWRQSLVHVQPLDFAPRPGAPPEPEEEEPAEAGTGDPALDVVLGKDVEVAPPPPPEEPPVRPAVQSRFKWLPPNPPGP
jgi:hypothetical protein